MPPKGNQLSLQQLSVEQLDGLKQQFESDVQALTQAFDGLRGARARFEGSKSQLESFKANSVGDDIMVPITSSLYVGGTIKTTDRVTVDVGTGFYIQQSVGRAQTFFDKRAEQMKNHIDKIQASIEEKQHQLNMIVEIMQIKLKLTREMAAMQEAEGQQQQ